MCNENMYACFYVIFEMNNLHKTNEDHIRIVNGYLCSKNY